MWIYLSIHLSVYISIYVADQPEVWLFREGRNNASLIHTGEDVTLKCSVVANPAHHTIQWTKQVNTIELSTGLREISQCPEKDHWIKDHC